MTSIIRPVSYHQMMRVSRNDIYWNMKEIFGCVDKVGRLRSKSLFGNVTNPFNDDEKKKNEEENAKKLKQAVKDIEQCYNKLKSGKDSMERLYNRKVIPYENMDDTYKSKAKNIYYRYSNAGEQIKTFLGNLGSGIKNLAEGFIKGFSSTVYSGIVGIVFWVGGLVGHGCNLVFGDSPNFLKPCEDGVSNFVQGVKDFIHDPTTLIDDIGQSVNDTYEEKGLAYMTGSLLGDAAGMYALGKAGDLGKGFVDNKLDIFNSKVNDINNIGRLEYFEKLKEGVIDDTAWNRLSRYAEKNKINLNDIPWEEKKSMIDGFKADIMSCRDSMEYIEDTSKELLKMSDKRLRECIENGYNKEIYYKILNQDKELRNPKEYLESLSKTKLVENWNNAFYGNDSAVVISYMPKDAYENFVLQYGTIGRGGTKGGQFVLPQKIADDIENKLEGLGTITSSTDEFKTQLAKELGLPKDAFTNGVVRVEIPLKSEIDLHMVTGIEDGCNYQWIPGGKTLGGTFEGLVRQITRESDLELYNEIIKNAKR